MYINNNVVISICYDLLMLYIFYIIYLCKFVFNSFCILLKEYA